VAGQAGITLAENDARRRFRATLNGVASSAVLAMLLTFQMANKFDLSMTAWATLVICLVAAISTLCGFLSIPRQPDKFFEGKLVDRQFSGSILEMIMFCWSRTLLNTKTVSTLRLTDLPALHLITRARYLTRQYVLNACSGEHGLRITLVKTHAGPLVSQWALTVLKSVAVLGPQFVTFRLLQWLVTAPQAEGRAYLHGLLLALALGLCKVFEIWISSWLQWLTASKLQIPIQATLSSLVYRKALRLPNLLDTSDGINEPNQGPRVSIITHMRLDRYVYLMDVVLHTLTNEGLTVQGHAWLTPTLTRFPCS